jgi:hypothetical protein
LNGPSSQTDKPISTIVRRTEYRVMASKRLECRLDMGGINVGYIGTDNDDRPWPETAHDPVHPLSQIALWLLKTPHTGRPSGRASRDRQTTFPPPVIGKPPDRSLQCRFLKPPRRNHSDISGETAFNLPEARCLRKNHKPFFHS